MSQDFNMQVIKNIDKNVISVSPIIHGSIQVEQIPVGRLIPMHDQPRTFFDDKSLEGLAQSIQNHGIIQPLVVTLSKLGNYLIIVGERRWRAAKLAGLATVPCILRDIKEHERLEMAIIENIQREAMSALDEANSYRRLLDEYDYTHEIIAQKLGKSRSSITNALRLLELPPHIINDLKQNKITPAHARALCGIEDVKVMHDIHSKIVDKKLTVRETEEVIRNCTTKPKRKKKAPIPFNQTSPDLNYMCEMLKDKFGTSVRIIGNSKSGTIEFSYYSMADLERFLDNALKNNLEKA